MSVKGLTIAKTPRATPRKSCINVPQTKPIMQSRTIDISEVAEVANIPAPTPFMTRPRDTKRIAKTCGNPDQEGMYWSVEDALDGKYNNNKPYTSETIKYNGRLLLVPPTCSIDEPLFVVEIDGLPIVVNAEMRNDILSRRKNIVKGFKGHAINFDDEGNLVKEFYSEPDRETRVDMCILPPMATPRRNLSLNVM